MGLGWEGGSLLWEPENFQVGQLLPPPFPDSRLSTLDSPLPLLLPQSRQYEEKLAEELAEVQGQVALCPSPST